MKGLKEVFANVKPDLKVESIGEESLLREDLGLDSLTMLFLALATEQKFNLQFDEGSNFQQVKDVIDSIEKKL